MFGEYVVPRALRAGDQLRVVAPSRSRAFVSEFDHSDVIERRLAELGLTVSYGHHVDERDDFDSSSIQSRVDDLHDAFRDPDVGGILTVIGGFNANELLPHLDWDLIGSNPKVFCGHSDITVLQGAMLARAGLVTYSGPHWSSFGMRDHFDRTLDWFRRAVMTGEAIEVTPSPTWTDDLWFADQDARAVMSSDGWWPIRRGHASGRVFGGNLCTFNLLQGTPWMPEVRDAVLMIEDDALSDVPTFARDLTSLLQSLEVEEIRAIVIGRFQRGSAMTRDLLEQVIARQQLPAGVAVLANVDFGHTSPQLTLPLGGIADVMVAPQGAGLALRGD